MSENHDHAAHDHQAPHGEPAWDERYRAKGFGRPKPLGLSRGSASGSRHLAGWC